MKFKINNPQIPIIIAAIHDGHMIRPELQELLILGEKERLREEDPYTANWLNISPNSITTDISRFEVDLNRAREKAIYKKPEDCWGLQVWKKELDENIIKNSLEIYDAFYTKLKRTLDELTKIHGHVIVYDIHSYNYKRNGPDNPPEGDIQNPEVNLGTGTMNRAKWEIIVDQFIHDIRSFDFLGRNLDIRENIKFKGGYFPTWIHQNYPDKVCCLSIEFRKFFMDEWSGIPDDNQISEIYKVLEFSLEGVSARLKEL